jgi:hypothetical protein
MNTLLTSIFLSINPAVWSIFLESDEGDGSAAIFLILLAGPIFFIAMYTRYRNTDKRHFHEKETPVQMSNLRAYDNFVKHLTRQDSSKIRGENGSRVEGSIVKSKGLVETATPPKQ